MTLIYAIRSGAATCTFVMPTKAEARGCLPRRAKAALPSRRATKLGDRLDAHMLDASDHQLGDALAATDHKRLRPEIDQQNLHLAAIVGVEGAGAVQNRHARFQREPRAGANLSLEARGQLNREAGGNKRAGAWRERDRRIRWHGRHHIEACGMLRVIGGKRQSFAVRQTQKADDDFRHSAAERKACNASLARASSRAAVSSLLIGGQSSTPAAVISCTCVWSPPMAPVPGHTSLATIQSAPLARRLAVALAIRLSVSAAKPITRHGRFCPSPAMVARMSGFWASFSTASPTPACFLSLWVASSAARQSATAAAQTAMSAGSASSVAAIISCAVSTFTTRTPSGSGSVTGPLTSVTSAPSAAAARASA